MSLDYSVSFCTQLAANLSTSYLSPALYDGVSLLADYLAVTGVLLSMCVLENCTSDAISRDDIYHNAHLSGSWIQADTTGPRTFASNGFGMSAGIGMILDPYQVDIECIYPLNGQTDMRNNNGCGELVLPNNTPWWEEAAFKMEIYWKKYTKFPFWKWEDIPCSKLLDFNWNKKHHRHFNPMKDMVAMIDHNQTWKTLIYIVKEWVEQIMGLPTVCYDDTKPDFSNDDAVLGYFGPDSWNPMGTSGWNDNAAITSNVIQEHPTSHGIWNEIVMKKIDTIEEYTKIIRAIFYVNVPNNDTKTTHYQKLAYAEAKRLGVKYVLEFNPQMNTTTTTTAADSNNDDDYHQQSQSLFRCPTTSSTEDGDIMRIFEDTTSTLDINNNEALG